MMNLLKIFLVSLALGLSIGTAHAQAVAPAASPAPLRTSDYVLGAGDVVRISVYQNPDLSLEARIGESGVISYPLIGAVKIGGLPVPQAEKLIADGLRGGNFIKQPQVSILVTQVRGNQASVLGQVLRPGRFPLEQANMTLSELLAMAGGIAPTGNDIVTLTGMRDGKPMRVQVDFPTIFIGDAKDVPVFNGDIVYVDRMPTVYIYGEVQRPGPYRIERGMTVLQALATGGGPTLRGTEKGIRIHRRDADSKVQVIQPAMDDVIKDGDVVYVRESLF